MSIQIIHDSNAVFDIVVNPFLRQVTIFHIPSRARVVWEYEELDEWHSYEFRDGEYDFHLLYEDCMEFAVYAIGDYSQSIPHNLSLEFQEQEMKSEEKFKKKIMYCKICQRPTVHALSKSQTFWACGCGTIIRIDTVSKTGDIK